MRNNWIKAVQCLILIQVFALSACKQGQGGNKSTKTRRGKTSQAGTLGTLNGKAQQIKGKMSDNSFSTDKNGQKVDLKSKECAIAIAKSSNGYVLNVTLGSEKRDFFIPPKVLETAFNKMEALDESVNHGDQTTGPARRNYITYSTSGKDPIQSIDASRLIFTFLKKTGNQRISDADWESALKEIPNNKELKDITLLKDQLRLIVKDKKISSVVYKEEKYINGSAAGSKLQVGKGATLDGEFTKQSDLQCTLEEPVDTQKDCNCSPNDKNNDKKEDQKPDENLEFV